MPIEATFVAADTGSKLTVTCKEKSTGSVIDLTGATGQIRFKIISPDKSEVALVTAAMTVEVAASGTISYTFTSGQLAEGLLVADVTLTLSGGGTVTNTAPIEEVIRARTVV